jgi:hypothetical protein
MVQKWLPLLMCDQNSVLRKISQEIRDAEEEWQKSERILLPKKFIFRIIEKIK